MCFEVIGEAFKVLLLVGLLANLTLINVFVLDPFLKTLLVGVNKSAFTFTGNEEWIFQIPHFLAKTTLVFFRFGQVLLAYCADEELCDQILYRLKWKI